MFNCSSLSASGRRNSLQTLVPTQLKISIKLLVEMYVIPIVLEFVIELSFFLHVMTEAKLRLLI